MSRLVLVFLACAALAACDSTDPDPIIEPSGQAVVPDTILYAVRDTVRFDAARLFTAAPEHAPTYEVVAPRAVYAHIDGSTVTVSVQRAFDGAFAVRATAGGEVSEVRVPIRATASWCAAPLAGMADYFALPEGDLTYDVSRTSRTNVYPEGYDNEDLSGSVVWSIAPSSCRLGIRSMEITETIDATRSTSYLQTWQGDTLNYRTTGPESVTRSKTVTIELGEQLPAQIGDFWLLMRSDGVQSSELPDRFLARSEQEVTIEARLGGSRHLSEEYRVTLARQDAFASFRRKGEYRDPAFGAVTTTITTLTRVE